MPIFIRKIGCFAIEMNEVEIASDWLSTCMYITQRQSVYWCSIWEGRTCNLQLRLLRSDLITFSEVTLKELKYCNDKFLKCKQQNIYITHQNKPSAFTSSHCPPLKFPSISSRYLSLLSIFDRFRYKKSINQHFEGITPT